MADFELPEDLALDLPEDLSVDTTSPPPLSMQSVRNIEGRQQNVAPTGMTGPGGIRVFRVVGTTGDRVVRNPDNPGEAYVTDGLAPAGTEGRTVAETYPARRVGGREAVSRAIDNPAGAAVAGLAGVTMGQTMGLAPFIGQVTGNDLEETREALRYLENAHPAAYLAGEAVGGATSPTAAIPAAAVGRGARAARGLAAVERTTPTSRAALQAGLRSAGVSGAGAAGEGAAYYAGTQLGRGRELDPGQAALAAGTAGLFSGAVSGVTGTARTLLPSQRTADTMTLGGAGNTPGQLQAIDEALSGGGRSTAGPAPRALSADELARYERLLSQDQRSGIAQGAQHLRDRPNQFGRFTSPSRTPQDLAAARAQAGDELGRIATEATSRASQSAQELRQSYVRQMGDDLEPTSPGRPAPAERPYLGGSAGEDATAMVRALPPGQGRRDIGAGIQEPESISTGLGPSNVERMGQLQTEVPLANTVNVLRSNAAELSELAGTVGMASRVNRLADELATVADNSSTPVERHRMPIEQAWQQRQVLDDLIYNSGATPPRMRDILSEARHQLSEDLYATISRVDPELGLRWRDENRAFQVAASLQPSINPDLKSTPFGASGGVAFAAGGNPAGGVAYSLGRSVLGGSRGLGGAAADTAHRVGRAVSPGAREHVRFGLTRALTSMSQDNRERLQDAYDRGGNAALYQEWHNMALSDPEARTAAQEEQD